jgi:hypothetical protein
VVDSFSSEPTTRGRPRQGKPVPIELTKEKREAREGTLIYYKGFHANIKYEVEEMEQRF